MMNFSVDPQLERNSFFIADLNLCKLYLKDDKENPWFVLVPQKPNAVELIDLNHEEQCLLMEEISSISDFLLKYYGPHKINVGALGNIVRQLHVHVLARYENDRAWPNPIWGSNPSSFFEEQDLEKIRATFDEFWN